MTEATEARADVLAMYRREREKGGLPITAIGRVYQRFLEAANDGQTGTEIRMLYAQEYLFIVISRMRGSLYWMGWSRTNMKGGSHEQVGSES